MVNEDGQEVIPYGTLVKLGMVLDDLGRIHCWAGSTMDRLCDLLSELAGQMPSDEAADAFWDGFQRDVVEALEEEAADE